MLKHLLFAAFFALALPLCAQIPEYKAVQYSGYINRFYTLCFDTENMLWAGGPSNGLPYGLPNGVLLHRVDANLNLKAGRSFDAEPDIEYPAEIGWDAGDRIIGCGNYQVGGFGKGFIFRLRPQTTPSQLLFLKKIEGGEVRLSGLIENTADTSLLVYGTSLEGGVQRGELFRLQRNTGTLRPGFPKRYSVGQGLSFDAAILHGGRLYTAGACSLGGNSTTFGLACLDAASGEPLWFSSNSTPSGQPMHLEARDLIFTDDDGDALLIVGSGDDQHSPAQGSHIFLQKSRLDGTLLWVKKIDLPDWTDEFAEEVAAVSDGYLVFGRSRNLAQHGVFLLKTDRDGKPQWAKRINQGLETGLPDWPAQAQMLVRNEAIYLTCNALVTINTLSPPNVGLLFKLQLDGTLANCSTVQPTPAVNLPFGNLNSIELGLSASASPLQVNTATGSVPTGISGTFGPGTICQQTGYLCNDRPDITARVDSAYCSPAIGGLGAAIRLCNAGKTANPNSFFISFYDSNPLTGPAKRLLTRRFFNQLDLNECEVAQFALSPAFKNNSRYYTLVGADTNAKAPILLSDFPLLHGFPECDYANNLDSFDLNLPPECYPTECDPNTFLRTLGKAKDFQNLSCLRASGDGNLYMAGQQRGRTLIAKMTPEGKFLWARSFTIAPFDRVALAEIIVDSEGMIVGCGRQGATPNIRGIAFRYDPNADQMLWIQLFDSNRPVEGGILERNPGGNYLLYQSPRLPEFLVQNAEILELDRATGQIVTGFAKRYQHGYSEAFACMTMHDGALYATGFVDSVVNNELARRMILTKLDPNTGDVIWSHMGHMEWERPAYFRGYDLLVDDNHLLTMYYGTEVTYQIDQGDGIPIYTFLQKSTLDGAPLWVKRYPFSSPKELIAVPDGYIISGGYGNHNFLKTDKDGNLLNAKRLTTVSGSNSTHAEQQNQLERIGPYLFLSEYETANGGTEQHTVLVKTDLDLNLEFDCNGYVPVTVLDSVPAFPPTTFPAPQTLRASPAVRQSPIAVFALDTVTIQKTDCPTCPDSVCSDKPDLTLRVDSITCLSSGAFAASVSVCNLGEMAPDTGFHFTFYDKNPLAGGAVALQSVFLEIKPDVGACVQALVPLDAALLQQAQVFTLAGADGNVPTPVSLSGFPFAGGFAECNYANNLDSFEVKKPICAPDSCHPNAFWKIFGRQGNWINISALRAAPDGNLYMAGRKDDRLSICKMAPDGQFLWTRSLAFTPLQRMLIAEIIVDSEGMIVGSGNLADASTAADKGVFAFRYNPTTDQVLWAQHFSAFRPTEGGILEKMPGGNFLLHYNPSIVGTDAKRAEILELDRATGQIVPAFAKRYEYQYSQAFNNVVTHNGAIYTTGYTIRQVGNSGFRRMVMSKLDASTGDVIWSRTGLTDWPQNSDFAGGDLIVDDNSLLALYYGSETGNAVGNAIKLYLQKTTLDGEVLWVKKYDLAAFPKELVATPDGYVIFAGAIARTFLKIDKEGNLLASKRLDGQTYFFSSGGIGEQNQVERIGQHLYFAHETARSKALAGYTTLLKTDLNLEMEFDCGLSPFPITYSSVAVQPNIAAQQTVTASPSVQDAVVTTISPDVIVVHKSCPTCATESCTDLPDITAHVDSITCSPMQGAVAHIRVCNLGQVTPGAGFHLTFYDQTPPAGNAVRLQSAFLQEMPAPGQCLQTVLPLNTLLLQNPKVYTLAGVDGNVQPPIALDVFPFVNGYTECDYANNLDSFEVKLPDPKKLDLGPDRAICQAQTATLDAGSGYATYQWLNGPSTQTYTVSTAGNYISEVTDECGRQQRDTVRVTVFPYPKRAETVVLLPGDTVTIGGKAYTGPVVVMDTLPSLTGGCDTLATYTIVLDSLGCKKPSSFLKTYEGSIGRVVLTASDSSVYVAGESVNSTTLSKYDAYGRHIWSRTLLSGGPLVYIASLIEDSEGMLAGSGSVSGSAFAVVFRYNPATNQMLWRRQITMDFFGLAEEFLEEKAGGDFLLIHSQSYIGSPTATEIQRLSRATGELLAGKAYRYEPVQILGAKMSGGMLYAVGGFKDSTASSASSSVAGLMKIDPTTGAIAWTRKVAENNASNGAFDLVIDAAGDAITLMGKYGEFWLQKTNPSGQLIWLRKYTPLHAADDSPYPRSIELSKDGNYIVSLTTSSIMSHGFAVVKIDKNGEVIWGRQVPDVEVPGNTRPQLLGTSNDDIFFTYGGYTITSPLFGKFDRDGNLGDNCGAVKDFIIKFSPLNFQLASVAPKFLSRSRTNLTVSYDPPAPLNLVPLTRCAKCEVPCDSIAITKTIQFYPGDTIVIDGVAYTQSGTVVQNLTTAAGCDSIVTNILQIVLTEFSISCPSDLTVTLPPNEIKTVVDYALPTATTTCPDPTITLRLLQGLPVGGSFSQGKTLVCYEAANECGIRDTCCFSITALPPDPACDVKTPLGCVRYELLGIRLDAQGQRRYRVRITNLCASPLEFAYIQLPNGVLAVSPVQGATYTAPGGNAYTVRNPNASPFYSIRYQAVVSNLNNGKSNVFEYTLPQQAQPAYIRASARLADGSYSETHLNTFYCPEVIENLELGMENFSRSSSSAPFSILNAQLLVRPNPTSGVLLIDLAHWRLDSKSNLQSETSVHLRVLNAQGQLVLERDCVIEAEEMRLDLPAGLASGLYYLVAQPEGGERAAVRFVVER